MSIAVRVEPPRGEPADVEYRWDADTDILTATLRPKAVGEGTSGSVEIQGSDGSWLVLDVAAGGVHGVEVAVWPEVKKRSTLTPPVEVEDGRIAVPNKGGGAVASLEMDAPLMAESDAAERTIHFRVGPPRQARTVRIARQILVDVDGRDRLAGVWLLDVPPFPPDAQEE